MKICFKISIILIISILNTAVSMSNTCENKSFGITAQLPKNWEATQHDDTQLVFKDTTHFYHSRITIKKYHRNIEVHETPDSWTRVHFIAYLIIIRNSKNPTGVVLYIDSSANTTIDSSWAPEAFCQFYSIGKNPGTWNEYFRFFAVGNSGFEIYVLGDISDMKKNIDFYVSIIKTIKIEKDVSIKDKRRPMFIGDRFRCDDPGTLDGVYNLLGVRHRNLTKCRSGIYLIREFGSQTDKAFEINKNNRKAIIHY